jgi:chemotaxis protein CheD
MAAAYLQPGELIVTPHPTVVTTVLGSCVAVCLWDPHRGVGGMNHYLLARGQGEGMRGLRFGNVAIQELLRLLRARGCETTDLRAKIFGGADVLLAIRSGDHSLGAQNVQVAKHMLEEARIPVVSEDVRGRQGRKLVFHTHSGAAFVRLLGKAR